MHKITVMGTSHKLLDIKNDGAKVILRTEISKAADMLKKNRLEFETLDFVYEKAENFDELDAQLATEVMKKAEICHVIYVVPGSGVAGDGSVSALVADCDDLEIIAGDAPEYDILSSVKEADAAEGYAVLPAACLERGMFSPRLPLVITALDNSLLVSDVKLLLADEYSDEHTVYMGSGGCYQKMNLHEMDGFKGADHETALFVPPKGAAARHDLFELEGVFKKLRSPSGCPWDREQTHESLKRYLLEECAEVLDAIDGGDMYELMDELGDVLLQVLFHATIASERGDFEMRDVVDNLVRKLVKRHPHVFADAQAEDPEAVLKQWDEIKHEEKEDKSAAAKLISVPKSMTALMRAQKVVSRAAKTELFPEEYNDLGYVLNEALETLSAMDKAEDRADILGKALFDIANISRIIGLESEIVLHDATRKYIKEFQKRELSEKSSKF